MPWLEYCLCSSIKAGSTPKSFLKLLKFYLKNQQFKAIKKGKQKQNTQKKTSPGEVSAFTVSVGFMIA